MLTIYIENEPLLDGELQGQKIYPEAGDWLMLRRSRPWMVRSNGGEMLLYSAMCKTEPTRRDRPNTVIAERGALLFAGRICPNLSLSCEPRTFDISRNYTRYEYWQDDLEEEIRRMIKKSSRALTEVTVIQDHGILRTTWLHSFLKVPQPNQIRRFVDFVATGNAADAMDSIAS